MRQILRAVAWLTVTGFLATTGLGQTVGLASQQRAEVPSEKPTAPGPRVLRDLLATTVIDREPVPASIPIHAAIGRVYYFTEVVDVGDPVTLIHLWFWQGRHVGTILLEVQGLRFRTWSYKTIPPSWTGEWRVEARTPDGKILSAKTFVVEPGGRERKDER